MLRKVKPNDMNLRLLFPLALIGCAIAPSKAQTIIVTKDSSVYSSAPNANNGSSTFRGGLFSGTDGITASGPNGPARFYLQFDLTSLAPGTVISSAILSGYYNDDWNAAVDGTHSIYLAANDAWTENGITWNNQPGTTGAPVATWNAAGASFGTQTWDITSVVDNEYAGDGILSLVFRADVEVNATNDNWEYFTSKEANVSRAFRLNIVTTSAAPEPGTLALLALGGVAVLAKRRRK